MARGAVLETGRFRVQGWRKTACTIVHRCGGREKLGVGGFLQVTVWTSQSHLALPVNIHGSLMKDRRTRMRDGPEDVTCFPRVAAYACRNKRIHKNKDGGM